MTQIKQSEWHEQWSLLRDDELFLFKDWIYPHPIEEFSGKTVLEGGCGGGQHTSFVAPYAKEIVSVDLNTTDLAKQRNAQRRNIQFVEADLSAMDLRRTFDIVFSIGVVHHTDHPDRTVENLKRHVKPGGKIILWVYSEEGNFLVKHIVEPIRKIFLRNLSRKTLLGLSKFITALLYIPVYTIYLLPLKFMPYFEYFENFRRLSFDRNVLNVFDKLNAPQVDFISQKRAKSWLSPEEFDNIHVSPYKGVSWRISGVKR